MRVGNADNPLIYYKIEAQDGDKKGVKSHKTHYNLIEKNEETSDFNNKLWRKSLA